MGGLPLDWAYWEGYCRRVFSMCDRVIVLQLDGWQESAGVQAELELASEWGLPVEFVEVK
jgi:hypothetical protein